MLTCRKVYADIPFAHRQHLHDGHCAFIHGHNWSIGVTFACEEVDENGFVIDFGKLHFIRDWLKDNLDHACVLNESDPLRETLVNAAPGAWKPYVVPNCSCEGLAEHLFGVFNALVKTHSQSRVRVVAIEIFEDSKNSARYEPSAG